jgi:hypothetical protein
MGLRELDIVCLRERVNHGDKTEAGSFSRKASRTYAVSQDDQRWKGDSRSRGGEKDYEGKGIGLSELEEEN